MKWTARYRLLVQVQYAAKRPQVRTESALLQPLLSKLFPGELPPEKEQEEKEEGNDEEENSEEDGESEEEGGDKPVHIAPLHDDGHWLAVEDEEWTRDQAVFDRWLVEDAQGFNIEQVGAACEDAAAERVLDGLKRRDDGDDDGLQLIRVPIF